MVISDNSLLENTLEKKRKEFLNHVFFFDELEQRVGELNPHTKLLVYCRTGNRSTTAAQTLLENGFTGFYHMEDGIEAWKQAGYPTISTD